MKFEFQRIVSQYTFKKGIRLNLELKIRGDRILFALSFIAKNGDVTSNVKEIRFGSIAISDISNNPSVLTYPDKFLGQLFKKIRLEIDRGGSSMDFCLKSYNFLLSASLPYKEAKAWFIINERRSLQNAIEADKDKSIIISDAEFDDDEEDVVAPRNLTVEQAWLIIKGLD